MPTKTYFVKLRSMASDKDNHLQKARLLLAGHHQSLPGKALSKPLTVVWSRRKGKTAEKPPKSLR